MGVNGKSKTRESGITLQTQILYTYIKLWYNKIHNNECVHVFTYLLNFHLAIKSVILDCFLLNISFLVSVHVALKQFCNNRRSPVQNRLVDVSLLPILGCDEFFCALENNRIFLLIARILLIKQRRTWWSIVSVEICYFFVSQLLNPFSDLSLN